nr:MAG: hypothetical protein J07AB56_09330 [Candidatus Nanosalinarum sp. J07AB56]
MSKARPENLWKRGQHSDKSPKHHKISFEYKPNALLKKLNETLEIQMMSREQVEENKLDVTRNTE